MKKKKKKIVQTNEEYVSLMFDHIGDYLADRKVIVTIQEHVLWIKRIITFIVNEFPKTKNYLNIISLLKDLIINDKDLVLSIDETKKNVGRILLDLARTFKINSKKYLFIDLHPKVKEHSLELFNNGHYAPAIFESVKALDNFIRRKANIMNEHSSNAMAITFNKKNPIIKLNALATRSDKDEQEGFMHLYIGAIKGIRNPKAHDIIIQVDRNRTLEYLAFLSLLFRRAEEGKVEKKKNNS